MTEKRHTTLLGRLLRGLLVVVVSLLFLLFLGVLATSVSPIYRFREPKAFSGPDIFNPYRDLDTAYCWKRASLHTHTRVKGPFPVNESEAWPQEVYDAYAKLGYDIVTFSNHNEITTHPFDSTLQVNVYEQGYSPYKFHKLVFGSKRVKHFDPMVPMLASQRQFELNRLGKDADILQINHPYRTWGSTRDIMESLSGYELMELDTHVSTENEYWDWALSAGHYSFGLANDDLHHPERHNLTAIRCNFICTPSGRYEDLLPALRSGCYYAMRVPDYGNGDWAVKREKNHQLPFVEAIGVEGDTLYLKLSAPADSIRVNGQNHTTLALLEQTDRIAYNLAPDEPYARFTAFFPDGAVLYTNPFARYDASVQDSPYNPAPQPVNVPLTLLWNLLLSVLIAGTLWLLIRLWR